MKKLFVIALLVFINMPFVKAKYIYIESQEDIDSFNYEVVDVLIIENVNEPLSIEGFESLVEIRSDFMVIMNTDISAINGFNNLESIGGSFDVWDNSIDSIIGFNNLKSIGFEFSIRDNSLVSIN